MTWKEFVHQVITDYCRDTGSSTLTLRELYDVHGTEFDNFRRTNHHPRRKVEQILQQLRDDGVVSFIDNEGTYRLNRPK